MAITNGSRRLLWRPSIRRSSALLSPMVRQGCWCPRFFVAQARALAISLLSADSKIRSYGHVCNLC
jgi:hypothetical protein